MRCAQSAADTGLKGCPSRRRPDHFMRPQSDQTKLKNSFSSSCSAFQSAFIREGKRFKQAEGGEKAEKHRLFHVQPGIDAAVRRAGAISDAMYCIEKRSSFMISYNRGLLMQFSRLAGI